ncbi:hypothetical protein HNY73_017359 [Argiope bruennichi]|uniref:DUF7041 domain-containing protein n=1 Tax=Argiope bruennichi TaxID=94029 RepID=A0A8T0EMU3_ARGBR|nr:hypothetical protein HNY73_017359 [Argiope bruennichi]
MATAETEAVVIPPFIKPDPALWFHMIDSTFKLASPKAIIESKTKYNYVVAHLPPKIATVVRDVIIQPHSMDRVSKRKSSNAVPNQRRRKFGDFWLLFELFNQAIPIPVQIILASISPISSDKAAVVADRILDINSTSISTISSGSERSSSPVKKLKSDMDLLRNEIKELRKEVADLRRSLSRFWSSSSTRRARSKSGGNRYCWYHFRFHEKAKRPCIPPCSFKGNTVPEE